MIGPHGIEPGDIVNVDRGSLCDGPALVVAVDRVRDGRCLIRWFGKARVFVGQDAVVRTENCTIIVKRYHVLVDMTLKELEDALNASRTR